MGPDCAMFREAFNSVDIYLIITYFISFESKFFCSKRRNFHQIPRGAPFLLVWTHVSLRGYMPNTVYAIDRRQRIRYRRGRINANANGVGIPLTTGSQSGIYTVTYRTDLQSWHCHWHCHWATRACTSDMFLSK